MRGRERQTFGCGGFQRAATVAMVIALSLVVTSGVDAQEVTVQNDSVVDFGSANIQAGFVANESAAAWLTTPCGGDLVKVQVLWLSLAGSAPDTLGDSIRVFESGAFPVPGTQLAELLGPVLSDGYWNEYTLDFPVPVTQDQTFVVSFRFLDDPPGTGPSVVTDTDGCQSGKNGLFAIPPSQWFNSCTLGVTGDFAIRAVVQCSGGVQYTLSVSTTGTGSGNITSSPTGINCGSGGSDCQEDFSSGTPVTLNSTPDSGSVAAGLRGTGPPCTDGDGVVDMSTDRGCIAEFTLQSDLIFRDGFEYGDTTGWDSVNP